MDTFQILSTQHGLISPNLTTTQMINARMPREMHKTVIFLSIQILIHKINKKGKWPSQGKMFGFDLLGLGRVSGD